MLTADERRLISGGGIRLLQLTCASITFTLMYGLFTPLFFLSTLSFLRRGKRQRATWAVFVVNLLNFALTTAHCIAHVVVIWVAILAGVEAVTSGDSNREASISLIWMTQTTAWIPPLIQALSDSVVVWRAWVLVHDRRIMAIPIVLLLSTFGTAIGYLPMTVLYRGSYISLVGVELSPLLFKTHNSLSLVANVSSTALIAYKLWEHRIEWNISFGQQWSYVQKIMLMIIESGLFYGVYQLVALIIATRKCALDNDNVYLSIVLYNGFLITTAMYPIIVLLLIDHNKSFSDIHLFSVDDDDASL